MNIREAYASCERFARTHYENFPVASRILPRRMRTHIAAIYAFARTADDFADEGTRPAGERLQDLDRWSARLQACAGGRAPADDPIFLALGQTIGDCALPVSLFEDLLSAFRQDVTTARYRTWDDVLDYSRRSANPVGRLVLRVAGHASDELDAASDAVCTALQLTNFWQDLERDWLKGRLYVPLADASAHGADHADLDLRRLTPAWRSVMTELGARTRALFDAGRPVCDAVPGRLGFELRLTWLGGRRILDALDASGFDVFDRRPALGTRDVPGLMWHALTWGRSRSAR